MWKGGAREGRREGEEIFETNFLPPGIIVIWKSKNNTGALGEEGLSQWIRDCLISYCWKAER